MTVRLASGTRLEFHVLSVLDDASRAVLAALCLSTPDLCAAVRAFRLAVKRVGLPDLVYADRASIFDSVAFRKGLRKNNFDLRRACALQNLETLHRMTLSIAEAKAA